MTFVHLIRHAPPLQDPSRSPWEWSLAAQAAEAVSALRNAGVLPDGARWVSSPEPKALETAALLSAGDVGVDDDLREARRSAEYVATDVFERRVLASFADPARSAAPLWEPLATTRSRIVRAAQRAVAAAAGADVVLVGHGTALTLLVAALTDSPPDVEAWQRMRMPDHCALLWPDRLASAWGHWAR